MLAGGRRVRERARSDQSSPMVGWGSVSFPFRTWPGYTLPYVLCVALCCHLPGLSRHCPALRMGQCQALFGDCHPDVFIVRCLWRSLGMDPEAVLDFITVSSTCMRVQQMSSHRDIQVWLL